MNKSEEEVQKKIDSGKMRYIALIISMFILLSGTIVFLYDRLGIQLTLIYVVLILVGMISLTYFFKKYLDELKELQQLDSEILELTIKKDEAEKDVKGMVYTVAIHRLVFKEAEMTVTEDGGAIVTGETYDNKKVTLDSKHFLKMRKKVEAEISKLSEKKINNEQFKLSFEFKDGTKRSVIAGEPGTEDLIERFFELPE